MGFLPEGMLQKGGDMVTRAQVAFVLAGLFAVSVAMCVAPPYAEYLYAVDTADLDTGDTAWMLTSSALVLIMTPGKPTSSNSLACWLVDWL